MNNDLLARLGAVQEFLADPAKGLRFLGVERDARPDAGMHKGIVAQHDHVLERRQEIEVRLRYTLPQQLEQLRIVAPVILTLADSIAQDCLLAADSQEERQRLLLSGQRFQEHLFVIAQQEADLLGLRTKLQQALHDLRRIGAPVDQISQEDDYRISGTARDIVRLHLTQEVVEQVQPPVNVAHSINALTGGNGSQGSRLDVALPRQR